MLCYFMLYFLMLSFFPQFLCSFFFAHFTLCFLPRKSGYDILDSAVYSNQMTGAQVLSDYEGQTLNSTLSKSLFNLTTSNLTLTTKGRFHQNLRTNFCTQDSTPFLANGVHILANFDLILALLLCW